MTGKEVHPDDVMVSLIHSYGSGYLSFAGIELAGLPETVTVGGQELLRKGEFHISLACLKRLAPMVSVDEPAEVEAEMVELFKDYIDTEPLDDFELLPELRRAERDERVSLVVMTFVPGLVGYFDLLRHQYGVDFPDQPTHITLYTLQPEAGIGILSAEQVAADTRAVSVPELAAIRVR